MKVKSFDVLLLFALLLARVRIDTLADRLVAQRRVELIKRIPLVGSLLPQKSLDLLEHWMTDPISLLLISITFALLILYVFFDLWQGASRQARQRAKLAVLFSVIFTTVIALSVFSILLRQVAGPATFSHDGGVIQTEEAIKFLLAGKNPYVEDYVNTPLAEWGLEYRTALYHYPYLPWTFLFSAPFYGASEALLGWYDQRFVYLALFLITLLVAARLTNQADQRLCLIMVLGLNPIMGTDLIFGQNDVFVLAWIVLSIYLLNRGKDTWSMAMLGLACASKPTAWFLLPFYFLFLARREGFSPRSDIKPLASYLLRKAIPLLLVLVVILAPFALWDAQAMFDDVWAWSSGTAEVPYQITGWGLANFVLALGLVESRLDYFPFWIPELLVCVPLLCYLLWRQWRHNSVASMLYHYAFLTLAFFYTSRFMNENYLGFLLAILALGFLGDYPSPSEPATPSSQS
ncbi:MAG TPA: glycosyltransferase family 87 protein [Anaerolineae bacterium]|nr:glycosyltransferase family 87 protein [Anaerolineae bacterium]